MKTLEKWGKLENVEVELNFLDCFVEILPVKMIRLQEVIPGFSSRKYRKPLNPKGRKNIIYTC